MPTIDLRGEDGNACALMGYARRWGRQLNLDVKDIISQMMDGDYKQLVSIFEEHFGHVCEIIYPDDWEE